MEAQYFDPNAVDLTSVSPLPSSPEEIYHGSGIFRFEDAYRGIATNYHDGPSLLHFSSADATADEKSIQMVYNKAVESQQYAGDSAFSHVEQDQYVIYVPQAPMVLLPTSFSCKKQANIIASTISDIFLAMGVSYEFSTISAEFNAVYAAGPVYSKFQVHIYDAGDGSCCCYNHVVEAQRLCGDGFFVNVIFNDIRTALMKDDIEVNFAPKISMESATVPSGSVTPRENTYMNSMSSLSLLMNYSLPLPSPHYYGQNSFISPSSSRDEYCSSSAKSSARNSIRRSLSAPSPSGGIAMPGAYSSSSAAGAGGLTIDTGADIPNNTELLSEYEVNVYLEPIRKMVHNTEATMESKLEACRLLCDIVSSNTIFHIQLCELGFIELLMQLVLVDDFLVSQHAVIALVDLVKMTPSCMKYVWNDVLLNPNLISDKKGSDSIASPRDSVMTGTSLGLCVIQRLCCQLTSGSYCTEIYRRKCTELLQELVLFEAVEQQRSENNSNIRDKQQEEQLMVYFNMIARQLRNVSSCMKDEVIRDYIVRMEGALNQYSSSL